MDALAELRSIAERHARPGPLSIEDRDDLGLRLIVARRGGRKAVDQVFDRQVGFVVAGEKRVVLGERRIAARAGHYFIAPVALPVALHLTHASPEAPFVAIIIALDPIRVASLLADAAHEPDGTVGLEVSTASSEVLDALVRLVRLLDHPKDIAVLGPVVERELLYRLLCGDQGDRLREFARADSRVSQIGRAMHWIHQHYKESLRIGDLARFAGMSATSFHRHFRAVAGMSPLQYQKQLRLQAARARLLASGDAVARVGHTVGYASPAQFSRDYKRAFGASPSRSRRQVDQG
jgi:AraC-like DNA-binding protein